MAESDALFGRVAYAGSTEGPYGVYVQTSGGRRSFLGSGESPAWSPDGERIALQRGRREIVIVGADGSDSRVLSLRTVDGGPSPVSAMAPTWSPDGTRIAFLGIGDSGPYRLYVGRSDGTDVAAVTLPDFLCGRPAWSPEGDVIAMSGRVPEEDDAHLYTVRVDGTAWTQLTDLSTDGRPAWSPDGDRLAFASPGGRLWVVGADGTGLSGVGESPLGWNPTWTPGGTHLAYGFSAGICAWIYAVSLDGADPRPVVDAGSDAAFEPGRPGRRFGRWFASDAKGSAWRAMTTPERRVSIEPGAIVVDPSVATRLQRDGDTTLQVRHRGDMRPAMAAIEAARADIYALDPPQGEWARIVTSPPLPIPSGAMLRISVDWDERTSLVAVPKILVRHLESAGVTGELVVVDTPQGLGTYGSELGRGVSLWLHPSAPSDVLPGGRERVRMPEGWLDIACTWVSDGLRPNDEVRVNVTAIDVSLPARDLPVVARHCHLVGWESVSQASFSFVAGSGGGQFTAAHASLMGRHWLQLAAGGARSDDDMTRSFERLLAVAAALAPETDYSWISFEDKVRLWMQFNREPEAAETELVLRCCDEIVLDAFPYQVLGPGHAHRLGLASHVVQSATTLEGGRLGVAVDDAGSWLRNPDAARSRGRRELAPCLVTRSGVRELLERRSLIDGNPDVVASGDR